MRDRFHTPHPLAVGAFTLDGPDGHHLATVLRAKPGQLITLFNGSGCEYPATVTAVGKKSVEVQIENELTVDRERSDAVIIAAAMPKGDRGDFLVEKLVELGAARFVPLITERTVVVPKGPRIESLRRTVIEASKQCGRNRLMEVEEPVPWKLFANRTDLPEQKLLLHPDGEAGPGRGDRVIAVGPEGGFTDAELAYPGWQRITLGPRILRIETAAITSLSLG